MTTVTLKLIVDGQTYDFSDLVRTYESFDRACSEDFRHAVSTRSLTMVYTPQLLSILSQNNILVEIDVNRSRDFTGRLAPSSLQTRSYGAALSGADVEDLSIEFEDNTYLLERQLTSADGLVIENAVVCDASQPGKSCVHRLLGLAGLEVINPPYIATALLAFAPDPGQTILDVLDTLLYEYGYTFTFDPYGRVKIIKIIYDNLSPQLTLTERDIKAPLEIEKLYSEYDSVEVSYYPLKYKERVLLYMADLPFGDNGLRSGWPIQPGCLWPEEANVQETWFEYTDKAIGSKLDLKGNVVVNKDFTSIVMTKNHAVEEKIDDNITRTVTIFENKRARLVYKNIGSTPKNIYYCNILGDCIYRAARSNLMNDIISPPANLKSYETSFIHDAENAQRLLGFITEQQRSSCWRYKFKSDAQYQIGAIVAVVDPFSGLNAITLLSEAYFNADTKEFAYKAIGLASPTLSSNNIEYTIVLPEPKSAAESALNGAYYELRYQRSATQPATPTGDNPSGWYTDPSQATGSYPLWMTRGLKNSSGVLQGTWSSPVQVTGEAGASGVWPSDNGLVGYWNFDNVEDYPNSPNGVIYRLPAPISDNANYGFGPFINLTGYKGQTLLVRATAYKEAGATRYPRLFIYREDWSWGVDYGWDYEQPTLQQFIVTIPNDAYNYYAFWHRYPSDGTNTYVYVKDWYIGSGEYLPNSAQDGSINSLHGTITAACVVPGIINKGLSFDGMGRVGLPNVNTLKPTNAVSFSAWVLFNGATGNSYIYLCGRDVSSGYMAYFTSSNVLYATVWGANGATSASWQAQTNTWYHVAFTYSSTEGGWLYINGNKVGSLSAKGSIVYTEMYSGAPSIGSHGDGYYYKGIIDEVRIYDRALTDAEVYALYAMKTAPAAIQVQRDPKYLGTTTDNPPTNSTFSADRIVNDWCLSTTAKQFYRWDGTAWVTTNITQGMKSEGFLDLINIADASDTQLFAQQLVAVDAFVQNLMSKYLKVTGSLRIGNRYDENGNVVDANASGSWLGNNGVLKAKDAEISGTLSGKINIKNLYIEPVNVGDFLYHQINFGSTTNSIYPRLEGYVRITVNVTSGYNPRITISKNGIVIKTYNGTSTTVDTSVQLTDYFQVSISVVRETPYGIIKFFIDRDLGIYKYLVL